MNRRKNRRENCVKVCRAAGFTLVELLVVIAMVAVLALVIFSVAGKMRSKAKATHCMSNLRQTGILLQAEASELGYYPPSTSHSTGPDGAVKNNGDTWDISLSASPCVGCPAAKHYGVHPSHPSWQISSYGANPMICDDVKDNNPPYTKPAYISRPAEVILLADGAQFNDTNNPRTIGMCAAWWLSRNAKPNDAEKELTTTHIPDGGFWDSEVALIPMRHDGKANILFVDGHIASISDISELKQKNLYWQY